MRIASIESTDLFVGTAQRPLQVVRVTLVNEEPGTASARLGVQGAGVRDPGPFGINDLNPGEEKAFEVPVEVAAPYQPGSHWTSVSTAQTFSIGPGSTRSKRTICACVNCASWLMYFPDSCSKERAA